MNINFFNALSISFTQVKDQFLAKISSQQKKITIFVLVLFILMATTVPLAMICLKRRVKKGKVDKNINPLKLENKLKTALDSEKKKENAAPSHQTVEVLKQNVEEIKKKNSSSTDSELDDTANPEDVPVAPEKIEEVEQIPASEGITPAQLKAEVLEQDLEEIEKENSSSTDSELDDTANSEDVPVAPEKIEEVEQIPASEGITPAQLKAEVLEQDLEEIEKENSSSTDSELDDTANSEDVPVAPEKIEEVEQIPESEEQVRQRYLKSRFSSLLDHPEVYVQSYIKAGVTIEEFLEMLHQCSENPEASDLLLDRCTLFFKEYQKQHPKEEIDPKNIKQCLEECAKPLNSSLINLLEVAIANKNVWAFHHIRVLGVDFNAQSTRRGFTPLIKAIEGTSDEHMQIFEELLKDEKVDVNQPMRDGTTPLMKAALVEDKKKMEMLIAKQADVNQSVNPRRGSRLELGVNAKFEAPVEHGQLPLECVLRRLIKLNSPPQRKRGYKPQPPMAELIEGQRKQQEKLLELARILIQAGAKSEGFLPLHGSILHLALKCNLDINLLKQLIANGVDITLRDFSEETPIDIAIRLNKIDILVALAVEGAMDVKIAIIDIAHRLSKIDILRALAVGGAMEVKDAIKSKFPFLIGEVLKVKKADQSDLLFALQQKPIKNVVVESLLKNGVDPKGIDPETKKAFIDLPMFPATKHLLQEYIDQGVSNS